jgi:mannose-1-phosphate guanylyltransferase
MLVPVILSGGAGTRLWPLSRELHPKQLLALIGRNTMLQETILRLAGVDASAPIVVCNETHRFLVAEQLRCDPMHLARHRSGADGTQHRARHCAGSARCAGRR